MVRPIRVPRADVGTGAPAALPSIAAQTAGARAAAGLGQTAASAIGGLVERQVQKSNNLALIRQGAESTARLASGMASAKQTLQDYVQSDEYNDEGYAALREEMFGRAFEGALEGVSHPQVRARLEGQRDGLMAADLGAEFADNALTQDSLAVQRAADTSIAFLEESGPDAAPEIIAEAGAALAGLEAQRPELRGQIQSERKRIFEAVQTTYLAGGAKGELRYHTAISRGDFNGLGLDVIGRAVERASERRAQLLNEMTEAAALDDDWGVLSDEGGRFASFSNIPETLELQALRAEAEDLDEFERDIMVRKLDVMIARRERRAASMKLVESFNEGTSPGLPNLGQNPGLAEAYDAHFNQAVKPWLDNPATPNEEKVAFLQRTFFSLGVVPESAQQWIQGNLRTANPNPETLLSIAKAFVAVDPMPLPGLRRGGPGGQQLTTTVGTDWLKAPEKDLLRFMAQNAGEGPGSAALAYEQAIDFRDAKQSGGAAGAGSLSPTLDSKAAKQSRKELQKISDRISDLYGGKIDVFGQNMADRYRELATAEAHRLLSIGGTGLSEEQALEAGYDLAGRQLLDTDPPVRLFDRTFMSGPINELFENGKYTARTLEMQIVQAFNDAGEDVTRGNMLNRFQLIQEDGMAPNEFRILVLPGKGDPVARWLQDPDGRTGRFRFDGPNSVEQKTLEGLRLAGVEKVAQNMGSDGATAMQTVRDDLFDAAFLTRDDFVNRYASPYESSLVPFGGADDLTPLRERNRIRASAEELQARRDNLFSRVESGERLFTVRKQLADSWQREYDATTKKFTPKALFEIIPGVPVYNREGFSPESLDNIARQAADKAVRIEIERELKDASVAEIMRFFETGLYPSEDGPSVPALRPPTPVGPGLPEIGLDEAFSPSDILGDQQ